MRIIAQQLTASGNKREDGLVRRGHERARVVGSELCQRRAALAVVGVIDVDRDDVGQVSRAADENRYAGDVGYADAACTQSHSLRGGPIAHLRTA